MLALSQIRSRCCGTQSTYVTLGFGFQEFHDEGCRVRFQKRSTRFHQVVQKLWGSPEKNNKFHAEFHNTPSTWWNPGGMLVEASSRETLPRTGGTCRSCNLRPPRPCRTGWNLGGTLVEIGKFVEPSGLPRTTPEGRPQSFQLLGKQHPPRIFAERPGAHLTSNVAEDAAV